METGAKSNADKERKTMDDDNTFDITGLTLKEKMLIEVAVRARIIDIKSDLRSDFLAKDVAEIFNQDLKTYQKLQQKL